MARCKLVSILAGLLLCGSAWADAAGDFDAGRQSYQRGDVRAAISQLRKSADTGHAPSQSLLGEILDHAEQNEEAVRYFRLAAAQEDAGGYYGLAVMQLSGEGTPRDPAAARQAMVKAAQLGHKQATAALALAYMRGGLELKSEERDSPEALRWILAAAANDHLDSIDRLAIAYRKGELGLATEVKNAEALEARARDIRGVRPGKTTKKRNSNG